MSHYPCGLPTDRPEIELMYQHRADDTIFIKLDVRSPRIRLLQFLSPIQVQEGPCEPLRWSEF